MMGCGGKNELVVSRSNATADSVREPGVDDFDGVRFSNWIAFTPFYIYLEAAHYTGWHSNKAIDPETVFAYTDKQRLDERLCGIGVAAGTFQQVRNPSRPWETSSFSATIPLPTTTTNSTSIA